MLLSSYEQALTESSPLHLLAADGRVVPLAIARYLADADEVDETVLARSVAPVLDVGCGPGRIVHALLVDGKAALGVDVADVAVALATSRGGMALNRSVFDRLPGEGRWATVLLLDGNVGISGDPASLLTRAAALMALDGQLIVEASDLGCEGTEVLTVRFARGGSVSGPEFRWALLDVAAVIECGRSVGLRDTDQWSAGGRSFVRFCRAGRREGEPRRAPPGPGSWTV